MLLQPKFRGHYFSDREATPPPKGFVNKYQRALHESGLTVIPAKAGIQLLKNINEIKGWIPAL